MERYRPPDRSKYLLKDEIKRLLASARSMGDFAFQYLSFEANTGVRPSESNTITVRDVSVAENRVRVRTLKQKAKAGEKAREVHRDIDLSPGYSKQLDKYLRGRSPEEILFPKSRVTLWRMFKDAARRAGLSKSYTLYGLRHSRCIYLLEWVNDLFYVSQQMGHSSLDVTKVYYHCMPSKRESYVNTKLGTF